MLILAYNVWMGYTPEGSEILRARGIDFPPKNGPETFATRLPLAEAIRRMAEREAAIKAGGSLCHIEYTLWHVCQVDDLTDEEVHLAHMCLIEHLPPV